MSAPFGNYQYSVYLDGLQDKLPALPFTSEEWERLAREKLSDGAYGYIAGGAGAEDTMRANLEAFRERRIVPRMLRDISQRDLSVELFGTTLVAPVLLAPVGVQSIAHPDAEIATARGAARAGVPFVLSTASSKTMEDVATSVGDAHRWFQLYWPRDRELAASLLRRAEAAGFSAIVVTLDTWILGWRPRDLKLAFLPFLRGEGLATYFSDPVFRRALASPPEDDPMSAAAHWMTLFSDPTVTWSDLAFIRENTTVPIVLKGILHPDDAARAVDEGMDGVIVSNHGGRQVDGAIASLRALPAVAERVGRDVAVLFDGGIRTGADIVKALCLGARAVLLGRPFMWGLAVAGEDGVAEVVQRLLAELDLTMALSGNTSLDQLGPHVLA